MRFDRLLRYAMFVTSTCANWKALSIVCSLTIRCKEPPIATVEPTATFGPSGPHLFLELLSAKWACMGKGEVVCVRTTYCEGVIVKV